MPWLNLLYYIFVSNNVATIKINLCGGGIAELRVTTENQRVNNFENLAL